MNVNTSKQPVRYEEYQYEEDGQLVTATAFSILPTTATGLAASDDENVAVCVLRAMKLPISNKECDTRNKNATSTLKKRLKDLGMKMDDRVVRGHRYWKANDVSEGWENRGMRFYFKGKCSDVTKNQTKLEPAKPPQKKK